MSTSRYSRTLAASMSRNFLICFRQWVFTDNMDTFLWGDQIRLAGYKRNIGQINSVGVYFVYLVVFSLKNIIVKRSMCPIGIDRCMPPYGEFKDNVSP